MDFFGLVRLITGENSETRWEFVDKSDSVDKSITESASGASTEPEPTAAVPLDADTPNQDRDSIERSESNDIDESCSCNDKKKKSKKKPKKKKNRSRANSTCSVNSDDNKRTEKHVQWGLVNEVLFDRDIGEHAVPNSGLYPLALGDECARTQSTVDDYTHNQQLNLLQRVVNMGLDLDTLRGGPSSDPDDGSCSEGDKGTQSRPLETRQYDYRRGPKNPLFSPLPETERCTLIPNRQPYKTTVPATLFFYIII